MDKLTGPTEDRRGHGDDGRRFDVLWDLTAGHRTQGAVRGQIVNVSVSGVLMRVPATYDAGTYVEIEMSPSVGVFIRAIVQIARVDLKSADWVQHGARIASQSDDDRQQLKDILLAMRRQQLSADFGPSSPRASVRRPNR